ncbi:molybdopterin biosynthesis protein, partial [bacterium]
TAEPVFARISSPHYHASAMDGIAVRAADTFGASETSPVRLKIGRQAFPLDTGDPLPAGCDAVIMIEQVHRPAEDEVEIIAGAAPWQHIRPLGEDMVATEMVVPANHRLRPVDIGGILAGGKTEVAVRAIPRVAVLPTGTELVQPGDELKPGSIIEFNSRVISGLVSGWGGQPIRYPITVDDYAGLKDVVAQALAENDIVVINAGSSAGSEDFTAAVIRELGEVLVHGVAIKPGKPVILGHAAGKPVIGVPGYPVSAVLNCELFLRPVVAAKAGIEPPGREKMTAVFSRKVISPQGVDEFVRVKLGAVGDKIVATPVSRGAGVLTSLIRADGIVRIPRHLEGFDAGTPVEVELLRRPEEVAKTTVVVGSHDITLDVLANHLRVLTPDRSLSSAHVGSLGGLLALKRVEAHMAGIHLLDEATGEYNIPYIKRMLAGLPVVVVNLTYREQGLLVPRGNPKGIKEIKDLARPDVSFINRQRGAGTRILLDYHLQKLGIKPDEINGYDREEYTHMTVAAAVAGGGADAGLGILAAARALELDFVPVAQERYDLVIPEVYWDTEYVTSVLAVLNREKFRRDVLALGGYDLRDMGKVVYRS